MTSLHEGVTATIEEALERARTADEAGQPSPPLALTRSALEAILDALRAPQTVYLLQSHHGGEPCSWTVVHAVYTDQTTAECRAIQHNEQHDLPDYEDGFFEVEPMDLQ